MKQPCRPTSVILDFHVQNMYYYMEMERSRVLHRRADAGAFASGHSAATDSASVSYYPFNHNDIVFGHPLEQRVG